MALLNVSAAARAVGKDRATIHRKLKSGELSATLDASGNRVIDSAELLRVFGPLVGVSDKAPEPVEPEVIAVLRAQVAAAEARVAEKQAEVQWLRERMEAFEQRLMLPAPAPQESTDWATLAFVLGALAIVGGVAWATYAAAW